VSARRGRGEGAPALLGFSPRLGPEEGAGLRGTVGRCAGDLAIRPGRGRGGVLSFYFLFPISFIPKPISNPFRNLFEIFQTLVKITHLKNKMHQHDLHTIVAKPYIKFLF
jgi:hypothetical protein